VHVHYKSHLAKLNRNGAGRVDCTHVSNVIGCLWVVCRQIG